MPYSAVTQPSPVPFSQRGVPESIEAVHSTWVSPNFARQEPSAYLDTPVSSWTSRSWSKARPEGRSVIMGLDYCWVGGTLIVGIASVQPGALKTAHQAISFSAR